ncbi:NYN domain-containing protein [Irregularibacter muris]|uniref:NYN domain-containing protein n=1 Tax=Irregularibacter muris TaxID=1796619 RepID=A0AAE3HE73_9FIRM|nr:NYN domain-containing protein [Irregularibacter muris]MCR1897574.1 NYN domain-containing protein [Irregularibacter muris]
MNQQDPQKKLAVLIDADNTSPAIIEGLIAEIANYGVTSVKRIYGDWTSPNLLGWKELLLQYAIQPIQQFSYTTGKNSTDSAMIIDAMDLLYMENLDGFCIVSSDSDFTRLASRIRETGRIVFGFGEKKTPRPFVGACDKFIYTEILRENYYDLTSSPKTTRELKNDTKLVNLLRSAVEDSADENGWSHLGNVGQNLANKSPEFDPRNFGYKKLGELIKATQLFDINERSSENSPAKAIYIRDKRKK